jgi:hypothetical protein
VAVDLREELVVIAQAPLSARAQIAGLVHPRRCPPAHRRG